MVKPTPLTGPTTLAQLRAWLASGEAKPREIIASQPPCSQPPRNLSGWNAQVERAAHLVGGTGTGIVGVGVGRCAQRQPRRDQRGPYDGARVSRRRGRLLTVPGMHHPTGLAGTSAACRDHLPGELHPDPSLEGLRCCEPRTAKHTSARRCVRVWGCVLRSIPLCGKGFQRHTYYPGV